MTLPYKLGGTPRTAAERADLARFRAARRSRYCRQAEREGFLRGTREHGHRVSRLDGDTYDCGCAGCREEVRP